MSWPRTLSLYVSREIGLFAGLSLLGVGLVLISQQLFERLDQLLALGVGGTDALRVLGYVVAIMASHATTIAFAFGVTLAIGRLATNSELLAIRSLGIGLGALVGPTLLIAVAIGVGTSWLLADVEPRSRLALRQLFSDVALRGTIVQDGLFRGVQDRVIYVDSRSDDGALSGVMIHDRTNPARPYVAFAESGALRYDDASGVMTLSLESGQILVDPDARDPERVQLVAFDGFEYAFDAFSLLRGRYGARKIDELTTPQLREVMLQIERGETLRNLRKGRRIFYEIEVHRRQAMPWAPLWFGICAVAFGAGRRFTRGIALVVCASVIFAYYGSMTLAVQLATAGQLDPGLAGWAPNAVFFALGATLLWRVSRSSGE
jgi:lipopolysaccharide export LptBFGC system permease protein LptF